MRPRIARAAFSSLRPRWHSHRAIAPKDAFAPTTLSPIVQPRHERVDPRKWRTISHDPPHRVRQEFVRTTRVHIDFFKSEKTLQFRPRRRNVTEPIDNVLPPEIEKRPQSREVLENALKVSVDGAAADEADEAATSSMEGHSMSLKEGADEADTSSQKPKPMTSIVHQRLDLRNEGTETAETPALTHPETSMPDTGYRRLNMLSNARIEPADIPKRFTQHRTPRPPHPPNTAPEEMSLPQLKRHYRRRKDQLEVWRTKHNKALEQIEKLQPDLQRVRYQLENNVHLQGPGPGSIPKVSQDFFWSRTLRKLEKKHRNFSKKFEEAEKMCKHYEEHTQRYLTLYMERKAEEPTVYTSNGGGIKNDEHTHDEMAQDQEGREEMQPISKRRSNTRDEFGKVSGQGEREEFQPMLKRRSNPKKEFKNDSHITSYDKFG